MASVYTVETLLALKPVKGFNNLLDSRVVSYLALWRKYNQMVTSDPRRVAPDSTVVMQYRLGTPNKVFRRQWIHTHGTTAGLSDLPRYPIRVFSVRVKFLEQHVKRCQNLLKLIKRQFLLLREKKVIEHTRFGPPEPVSLALKPVKLVETSGIPIRRPVVLYSARDAVLKRQSILRRKAEKEIREKRILMETYHDSRDSYSRPVGGLVRADKGPYKLPPPKDGRSWKKYWYFFRKRGFWKPSEHHPYGDEEPVINDWLNGSREPVGD